jgi:hypothetical protein
MADGKASGIATVLRLLGAGAGQHGGEPGDVQDDLFEGDAPLPLAPAPSPEPAAGKARGRPPGARNRSTEEFVRFFLSQHRAPMSVLGNIVSQPLGDLVDQLQAMSDKHKGWRPGSDTRDGYWERIQINPLEVLRLQRDAAVALMPYIHKKQPMALELDDKRQPGIVLLGSLDMPGLGDPDDLALPLPPIEENQRVIGADRGRSDGDKSDGGEK